MLLKCFFGALSYHDINRHCHQKKLFVFWRLNFFYRIGSSCSFFYSHDENYYYCGCYLNFQTGKIHSSATIALTTASTTTTTAVARVMVIDHDYHKSINKMQVDIENEKKITTQNKQKGQKGGLHQTFSLKIVTMTGNQFWQLLSVVCLLQNRCVFFDRS